MARLKRRVNNCTAGLRGLADNQRLLLITGMEFAGPPAFDSAEEYRDAWRQFRDQLVFAAGLFRRPDAFWWVELEMPPPDCPAGGNESQRDALIRLSAPLSVEELYALRSVMGDFR